MNHSLKFAALALVLLPLTAEAGATQDPPPPPQKIDAVFTEFDHSGSVGCAVGVARNGEFVYKKGYWYSVLAISHQASFRLATPAIRSKSLSAVSRKQSCRMAAAAI